MTSSAVIEVSTSGMFKRKERPTFTSIKLYCAQYLFWMIDQARTSLLHHENNYRSNWPCNGVLWLRFGATNKIIMIKYTNFRYEYSYSCYGNTRHYWRILQVKYELLIYVYWNPIEKKNKISMDNLHWAKVEAYIEFILSSVSDAQPWQLYKDIN